MVELGVSTSGITLEDQDVTLQLPGYEIGDTVQKMLGTGAGF